MVHYFVSIDHSTQQLYMCIKTLCIIVWLGNLRKKFENYPPMHNFWAWSSCTQGKKLKIPSIENLKVLNNVFQCNFNLAKQVTYEKKAWTFGGWCNSSLGGKLGKETLNQCRW